MVGRGLLSVGLLGVLGCSAASDRDPPGPSTLSVRDSAGVQIVEAPRGLIEELPEWALIPQLDLGGPGAPPEQEFFRVNGAYRAADGTLAVVNSGSGEVRFFDPDGAFLRSVGRIGDGPGEFRFPTEIMPYRGDTLAVFDLRAPGVTLLTADGEVGRTARLEGSTPNLMPAGVLPGGELVLASMTLDLPEGSEPVDSYAELLLFDAAGVQTGTLGAYPAQRFYRTDERRIRTPIFDGITTYTTASGLVWIGTGRDHELQVVDPSGTLVRLVRWWGPDLTVTEADRALRAERLLARADSDDLVADIRRGLATETYAERRAAYGPIRSSEEGDVWVQSGRRWLGEARWLILGSSGEPKAFVDASPDLRVMHIAGDWVTGAQNDDLGVTHVATYRIERR